MRAPFSSAARRAAAFTVIELMLGVAIMTLIVFGLYAVFDQTQKALRASVQQVDIFEGARAGISLLQEDLEQAGVGGVPHRANFYSGVMSNLPPVPLGNLAGDDRLLWLSAGELYVLQRAGNGWRGVGYWLEFDTNTVNSVRVGTLMRYVANPTNAFTRRGFALRPPDEWRNWPAALPADRYYELQPDRDDVNVLNLHRSGARYPLVWPNRTNVLNSAPVLANVVHLQVTAFDHDGVPITRSTIPPRLDDPRTPWRDIPRPEFLRRFELGYTAYDEMSYRFTGDVLPGALEVELGIVEPQIAERLRGFTTPDGAARFLRENPGRVHLFRQRIPLAHAPRS